MARTQLACRDVAHRDVPHRSRTQIDHAQGTSAQRTAELVGSVYLCAVEVEHRCKCVLFVCERGQMSDTAQPAGRGRRAWPWGVTRSCDGSAMGAPAARHDVSCSRRSQLQLASRSMLSVSSCPRPLVSLSAAYGLHRSHRLRAVYQWSMRGTAVQPSREPERQRAYKPINVILSRPYNSTLDSEVSLCSHTAVSSLKMSPIRLTYYV